MRGYGYAAVGAVLFGLFCGLPVSVSAQTITFATPGDPRTTPVETQTVLTHTLDQIVGGSLVSNAVNAAGQGVLSFEQQAAAEIAGGLAAQSQVKEVFWVNVSARPLTVTLSQKASTIGLVVEGVDISYRIKADGLAILCPSAKFTADISVSAAGDYAYSTGNLVGLSSTQTLRRIHDVSCSGVLGALVTFVAKPAIKSMIESKVSSNLSQFGQLANILANFSLADMTLPLPPSLGLGHASDMVLQVAREIFNRTSQNKGLNLKAEIHPNFFGPGNHQVTLTAFNTAPEVFTVDYPWVSWNAPASAVFDVYVQPPGQPIGLRMTTTATGTRFAYLPDSTKILVVGRNRLITTLKSFPGTGTVPVNNPGDCLINPFNCTSRL